MKASQACREFIEAWEGRRNEAYMCSAGHWTIGVGHRMTLDDLSKYRQPLTDAEVEELFTFDLLRFEDGVTALLGPRLTEQHRFDALISFAFNVGLDIDGDEVPEGLGDSTLLRHHLRGHYQAAADEFLKWNKTRDPLTMRLKAVGGLTKRRRAERAMYADADYRGRP